MAITAAVPVQVDENKYLYGYVLTASNPKILEADEKAIFADSITSLKAELGQRYPPDPDFPFLEFLTEEKVEYGHVFEGEPDYIPHVRVLVHKHPIMNLSNESIAKKFDTVVAAVMKYKAIRCDSFEMNQADRLLPHKIMWNSRRGWSNRYLLEYRPRAANAWLREKTEPKYGGWYYDVPVDYACLHNMLLSAVHECMSRIEFVFPFVNVCTQYKPDHLLQLVQLYQKRRQLKILTEKLTPEMIKLLTDQCEKAVKYVLPKRAKIQKYDAENLLKHQKDAATLLSICKILHRTKWRIVNAKEPVAEPGVHGREHQTNG